MKWLAIIIYVCKNSDLFLQKNPWVQAEVDKSSSALIIIIFYLFFFFGIIRWIIENRFSKTYQLTQCNKIILVDEDLNIQNGTLLQVMNSSNFLQYLLQRYLKLFQWDRSETLYSTMLQVNSIRDEKSKNDKIEPFSNFKRAYYQDKNLSLDEVAVKWKDSSKFKMQCKILQIWKISYKNFGLCDSHAG